MHHQLKTSMRMIFFAFTLVFGVTTATQAQEHPKQEHPKQEHPKEHPDKAGMVNMESLAAAITGYIKNDSNLKGGYFCIFDAQAKMPLALTLEKVHQDKLAKVSEGLYFACTDLKATSGKIYDLDFFMKEGPHGLEVSEVTIHKQDGQARYGWVEENGVWKRK